MGRAACLVACLALAGSLQAAERGSASADAPLIADPAKTVAIELRPRVSVGQAQVRLGDIAFVSTRDLPLLRQLLALPLGNAPRPGSPALLDRDSVGRWVAARSLGGQASHWIDWRGAAETLVESSSQQLPGETIAHAAQETLERWLAQRSVRAQVTPVSVMHDLSLPAGATSLHVRPLADQAPPARRMSVWVDVWVDDRFVRTVAVSFEVQAWAPLPVAASDLDRGTTLDAVAAKGALRTKEVELTALRGGRPQPAVLEIAETAGVMQRTRRRLREGEVLVRSNLEAVPAVARGDWADLRSKHGAVSIESRVEVLQDGETGEVVRVKVPGAKAELFARVVGKGRVEVDR